MSAHPRFCIALSICVAAAFALTSAPVGASPPPLTVEDVVRPGRLVGVSPTQPAWSSDSRWLAFIWASDSEDRREVWLVDRFGARRRRLTKPPVGSQGSVDGFDWLPDGRFIVLLRDGDLWRAARSNGATIRLTRDGGAKQHVRVSPDGKTAAYLREGDLWIVPTAGGLPRRVTAIGVAGPSVVGLGTYARRDREIGAATWASGTPLLAWAPDSRTLAVHIVDRSALPQVPFPYYLGNETAPNPLRRSYPGDANESRTVALVDIATGARTAIGLPEPTGYQVVHMAWSKQGRLLVDRMSDDNVRRELHVVDPAEPARPIVVHRDERASRIYTEAASSWNEAGDRVLMHADLDDRYRIYAIDLADGSKTAVTPTDADVSGAAVPLSNGEILYVANAPWPSERHVWRTSGKKPVRITKRRGTHRPFVSPDGRILATLFSDDVTPPGLWVRRLNGGRAVPVAVGGTQALKRASLSRPTYTRFPGTEGSPPLAAKFWLPTEASKTRKVPVLFGPVYVNTVRNRWDGRFGLLKQLLVQRGYAVMQVDVRGSTGYGRAFREKFLFEWGAEIWTTSPRPSGGSPSNRGPTPTGRGCSGRAMGAWSGSMRC